MVLTPLVMCQWAPRGIALLAWLARKVTAADPAPTPSTATQTFIVSGTLVSDPLQSDSLSQMCYSRSVFCNRCLNSSIVSQHILYYQETGRCSIHLIYLGRLPTITLISTKIWMQIMAFFLSTCWHSRHSFWQRVLQESFQSRQAICGNGNQLLRQEWAENLIWCSFSQD